MVSYVELTNALANSLRLIPELVAELDQASPASIIAYIDEQPKRNTLDAALYAQKPGTVIVAWTETLAQPGSEMTWWVHNFEIVVRALSGQSPYTLIDDIMNGVPEPGDGQRWRYCPVMFGVEPANVPRIYRDRDTEQIDVLKIVTEIRETGDL